MNICRTSLNCDGCSYWSLIRCDFLVDQCVYINNIIFTFVVSDRVQLSTSNFHENPKCTLYERVLQYFPGDYVDSLRCTRTLSKGQCNHFSCVC